MLQRYGIDRRRSFFGKIAEYGLSVVAFLDWVSGETGFTIRFADREVEQLAAATILHGNIAGLSPGEAPEVILPSCRLAVIEEPGSLLVRRLEPDEGGF
jgi:hypothetical protein